MYATLDSDFFLRYCFLQIATEIPFLGASTEVQLEVKSQLLWYLQYLL